MTSERRCTICTERFVPPKKPGPTRVRCTACIAKNPQTKDRLIYAKTEEELALTVSSWARMRGYDPVTRTYR